MKIKISNYIYDKVVKFADERLGGSKGLYNYRGKSTDNKLKNDIITGALGEYGIQQYLKSLKYKCSKPDLKIYARGEKSFDADLTCDDLNIHVKSQSIQSFKRYGASWLVQRSDKLYKEPKTIDVFAFTNVNLETKEVEILGFVYATDIKDNDLFGECKVPSFRHSKVALYLTDFEGYNIIKTDPKGE